MTREEAIAELKTRYFSMSQCLQVEELHKANESIDLAIEALQTEPCEDAISRQAMLAGLANIAKAKAKSDAQKAMMGRTMFFIEQLPSVQPEPFINKPCVSEGVCREDKMKVLEKIKAEMQDIMIRTYQEVKAIIDKYTAESEDEE